MLLSMSALGLTLSIESAPALAATAPVVHSEGVTGVGSTSATLDVRISPGEAATSYHFEYGPTTAYGSSIPVTDATIGEGSEEVAVSQLLTGLQQNTIYHYRVVATNVEGTVYGEDRFLKTTTVEGAVADPCPNAEIRGLQSSAFLPDCRAYEMVSPVDKGSANIATSPLGLTQSSVGGDAIKYVSQTAFGDAVGIGSKGAEYVGHRGTSGWVSHSINPEQGSISLGIFGVSSHYEAFSPDLSEGVFFALTPVLNGHPNVEQTSNLFLRTDMFSAPPGSYELLTDAVAQVPARPDGYFVPAVVKFAGASADFSHILFETYDDLTPEASGLDQTLPKVYEWVNGAVRLAGILPDGTPAAESLAGRGVGGGFEGPLSVDDNWAVNAISSDGSRVVFEGQPLVITEDKNEPEPSGNLYMRIDGERTIQLNVSERTLPTPNKPQSATPEAMFEGATPDDSKVFFTSRALMTDDASGEGSSGEEDAKNLYMYDLNAPAGKHLTLISVDREPNGKCAPCSTPRAISLLAGGISEDGSYVYFTGVVALVSGQPRLGSGEEELYVWHEGTVRAIAEHQRFGLPFAKEGEFWEDEAPGFPREFRVTPDGKHAVFISRKPSLARRAGGVDLAPGTPGACENNNLSRLELCQEVFVYDYETDGVRCVSCNPTGEAPEGPATLEAERDIAPTGRAINTQHLSRVLSADGRYVFFDSPDPLAPQDTNGRIDVYEFDTRTDRLSLISGGTSGRDSLFVDASADGSNVFFTTRQQVTRSDTDESADLYDARVDGGILRENLAPSVPCEGDDCQGPAKAAPSSSLPSSLTFSGSGNARSLESKLAVKAKRRPLTRVEKLARALKTCRPKHGHRRALCERRARSKYGPKSAKHASRRVGR
jgi:hypothetical protein